MKPGDFTHPAGATILAFWLLGAICTARADTLTLHVGDDLPHFSLLTAGTHRYLRYTVKDGARKAVDIWSRTISFETTPDGPAMHIVQRWDETAGVVVLIQDSWFEPGTFAPTTHIRHLERDGKITIGGYRFLAGRVAGMPGLANNERKDFEMPLDEPAYNFEYDMELLQTLSLAPQREFNIPFYDPGVDKPGRYTFKVAGSASITGPDGRGIPCWLVTADYNTGKVLSRFWFSRQGQVLIREEQVQKDGGLLIKTLLPPESGDLQS